MGDTSSAECQAFSMNMKFGNQVSLPMQRQICTTTSTPYQSLCILVNTDHARLGTVSAKFCWYIPVRIMNWPRGSRMNLTGIDRNKWRAVGVKEDNEKPAGRSLPSLRQHDPRFTVSAPFFAVGDGAFSAFPAVLFAPQASPDAQRLRRK